MSIDHIGLSVSHYDRSKQFYQTTLAPLGYQLFKEIERWAGFGKDGKADFWFGESDIVQNPMHIAFQADNRAQVNAFYEAAIAAGAKDNGKPGIREIYHPNYYGAFVLDPDGHNIEAVCHKPE
jgi:catechol 2,3-dioxygenase-like lactoylglutathione lyase family enzyme